MEQGLTETCQKVESSLLKCIEEHIHSSEFSSQRHGLDFLDTKNSLLLSYLIDLTVYVRNRLMGTTDDQNLHRLIEMRTILDKMRNLDKKLRYQIDKLLASSSASSFAVGTTAEDPLQFRPSVDAMTDGQDNSDNNSDESSVIGQNEEEKESDDGDLDDDLKLARETLRMARPKQREQESSVYRAPRLSAVPYTHDKEDRQAEREKRQRQRMRASELAQALRSQYGNEPEREDYHGGSQLGKQRETARRMAERAADKTKFEEEHMVRLTTTRKEKKERRRLMREESSNLAAIADLGNLVRDAAYGNEDRPSSREDRAAGGVLASGRHASGKRKRQIIDADGRATHPKGNKRSIQTNNALQAALFDSGREGNSKKKKKRKL